MATSTSRVGRLGLALLAVAAVFPSVTALDQRYCSTMNTGSGPGNASIYQTTGLCFDYCVGEYAFAVLTENLCWCSDYVPGTTVDRSDCDNPCVGYPDENCGGTDLYGYIKLNLQASGTKGAPSSTSKKPDATTVTAPGTTVTEQVLVTPSPPSSSSSASSSTPSDPSTTSPSKTSSSPSTTSAPSTSSDSDEPFASTVTEAGEERIITVVPVPAPLETGKKTSDSENSSGGGSKLGTGAAVGLTIGLVALASIVGLLIFFFLRRKKQARDAEALRSGSPGAPGSGVPSRTMSENSRYMLGTDGREVVGGWQQDGSNQPGNRRSRLMPVDPRLDPFAPVYQRGDGAHSRESVMSIRDDRDYSRRVVGGPVIAGGESPPRRVLGVINP